MSRGMRPKRAAICRWTPEIVIIEDQGGETTRPLTSMQTMVVGIELHSARTREASVVRFSLFSEFPNKETISYTNYCAMICRRRLVRCQRCLAYTHALCLLHDYTRSSMEAEECVHMFVCSAMLLRLLDSATMSILLSRSLLVLRFMQLLARR